MVVGEIHRDYLQIEGFERVGKKFDMTDEWIAEFGITDDLPKVRFHCKDDDGEIYYAGWLLNDLHCMVQESILVWCRSDAGCTTIEVFLPLKNRDGSDSKFRGWKQEIG